MSWSQFHGAECLRVDGVIGDADVQVRPRHAASDGATPPMAGSTVRDADHSVCFIPRFPFLDGTTYSVAVDGVEQATLRRARTPVAATAEVLAVYPSASEVPLNLLRLYVWFSTPMRERCAAQHVHLVTEDGEPMADALLPTERELWDPSRRRLTVLLDPARIKRGLVAHREIGYPLQAGMTVRLVVDAGFRDATGAPLRTGAERSYVVSPAEGRRVDPRHWMVAPPPQGTSAALEVGFDRPLDSGLLARCLRVLDGEGRTVAGMAEIGAGERSWRFRPEGEWASARHQLEIDPVLEDICGNSVTRVFDRNLLSRDDDPSSEEGPAHITFFPRR